MKYLLYFLHCALQAGAYPLLGSSFGVPLSASYDYVIVGGGTAGLTVAARLAEDPSLIIAVIEAGSFYEISNGNLSQIPAYDFYWTDKDPTDYNPLIDWGYHTVPQEGLFNASVHYPRGKCLGGSSARNYMAYTRGSKKSYDLWADTVDDNSYKWDAFLPFFQKSLTFTPPDNSRRAANVTPDYDLKAIGPGGGPLSVTFPNYGQPWSSWVQNALAEIGIKPIVGLVSGALFGSSYTLTTIDAKTQTRESSETGFLKPALKKGNIVVYQSTLAKRILFDGNKTATGVLVDTGGTQYTISARREVILSAGVFGSPQILMVSGIGPPASLQKHNISIISSLPGVGQNMWDHVIMGPTYKVDVITSSALANNPQYALQATLDYRNKLSGPLTNTGGDFFGWEKLPSSIRNKFPGSIITSLASFPADWPEIEYLAIPTYLGNNFNHFLDDPHDAANYGSIAAGIVAPLSRGTVDIVSNDTKDAPLIDPQWLTHPADQALAIAAYKRTRELFATSVMKGVLLSQEIFPGLNGTQTDEEILSVVKNSFESLSHGAATCKMGKAGDPMAVVDSKARVFGVEGLRVVDISAFALLPPGNPVSTVYALAEKIADDIKNNHQVMEL
ncbi:GMC oxidoreductase [Glonium stellatum]|uniref:GMC oxidoreductase n=1 Tax=Glonium stellatum TaxID=574774 RepID=A0A8E2JVE2_9PEZI|nr:GMC oxidoreductase [Glonium stellatum]